MRLLISSLLFVMLLGCSSKVELKRTPVSVSGKVLQNGQPFGGMVMVFHPLGDGHLRELPIGKDGTFNGELISGEYAYYVAKPTAPAIAQVVRKLPPKYLEADLTRTVTVEPDKQLAIELN